MITNVMLQIPLDFNGIYIMQKLNPSTSDGIDRQKSAAGTVLRWMNDEITRASEDHIKALDDNLSICLSRAALEKTMSTGEKISAAALCSVDGNRLDNLHLAAAQNPTDGEGRKSASEHTVRASKFLNLEHKLIDNDLVQYTVTPDTTRIGTNSRLERGNSARYLMDIIDEMRASAVAAEKEVTREPMVNAFYKALQDVQATGEQIAVSIASAMDNNANQKLLLSLSPTVHDAAGESRAYFEKQAAAYRKLATLCRNKDLIAGVPAEPQRTRG